MPVQPTAGSTGAAQIAKLLKDAPGGTPVKVTYKQFEGLSNEFVKIAKANPEIAMDIGKLLQSKQRTGDFDISDIQGIPSHGAAVSNAVKTLLNNIDKAAAHTPGGGPEHGGGGERPLAR